MERLLLIVLLAIHVSSKAQVGSVFQPGDYRDGIYTKENSVNKKYAPDAHLREADLMWQKRVWREIDLREKINHPLYYPTENLNGRVSLLQCLRRAIQHGEAIAFADEEFMIPLELSDFNKRFAYCDTAIDYRVNEETGEEEAVRVWRCDSMSIYERVTKFQVKEDWFFDKQRSVMECRIIGLCAMEYNESRDLYKKLFWVYFPQCRNALASNEVFNPKNDAERRSFDDIFRKRQFNSVVIKESNVYDRYINQYAQGIDALLESERVKNDIFQYEHDLWHF